MLTFLLGLFVGVLIGFFLAGLLQAAHWNETARACHCVKCRDESISA
jgi:hypothetical protein